MLVVVWLWGKNMDERVLQVYSGRLARATGILEDERTKRRAYLWSGGDWTLASIFTTTIL